MQGALAYNRALSSNVRLTRAEGYFRALARGRSVYTLKVGGAGAECGVRQWPACGRVACYRVFMQHERVWQGCLLQGAHLCGVCGECAGRVGLD